MVTAVLGLACVAAAKGRAVMAAIGVFVPLVPLVAGVRLARPSSPWARRFYRGERLERARGRFAPTRTVTRMGTRLGDLVAGAPTDDSSRDR